MEDQCWGLGPRRGCTLCAIVAYALQLLLAFVQVTHRFWNPCLSGRENAVSKVRVGVLFCFSRQSTRTQWLTPLLRCVLSLSRPDVLVAEWICWWKPFWIPTVDTFQKAYLEEWQLVDDRSIPWKEL